MMAFNGKDKTLYVVICIFVLALSFQNIHFATTRPVHTKVAHTYTVNIGRNLAELPKNAVHKLLPEAIEMNV